MKRITVLGAIFTMTMALGMSTSNSSTCCNVACIEAYLSMIPLQPKEVLKPSQGAKTDRTRQTPRMRPDRLGPNTPQSKERRGSFWSDRPMPPGMLEHVMDVAKEIDPDLADKLAAICEADPEAFEKIIRRQGRRFGSLVRLRESNPDLFEVKVAEIKTDAEIFFITEELKGHDLNDPSIQAQLMQLRGLVRAKTAFSIRAQTLYIKRLEQHLAGLRSRLEETTTRFDEIVDERLISLLEQGKEEKPE